MTNIRRRQLSTQAQLNPQCSTTSKHDRNARRKQALTPVRKSTRLQKSQLLQEQVSQLPSPSSATPSKEPPHHPSSAVLPSSPPPKQKRQREQSEEPRYNSALGAPSPSPTYNRETPARKRQRRSSHPIGESAIQISPVSDVEDHNANPVRSWVEAGSWPGGYLEPDNNMSLTLARKRSSASLNKHESETTGSSSIREGKNPAVKSRRYEQLLVSAGIYMDDDDEVAPHQGCKSMCQTLLQTDQVVPQDSLFNDSLIKRVCQRVRNKNEARVTRDLTPLLVPSAEILYLRGATDLQHLIETVNEGWIKSIPLVNGPQPQPDFSVGFKSSAFTPEQLRKLRPSIGD